MNQCKREDQSRVASSVKLAYLHMDRDHVQRPGAYFFSLSQKDRRRLLEKSFHLPDWQVVTFTVCDSVTRLPSHPCPWALMNLRGYGTAQATPLSSAPLLLCCFQLGGIACVATSRNLPQMEDTKDTFFLSFFALASVSEGCLNQVPGKQVSK